jgi:hypothetical protein
MKNQVTIVTAFFDINRSEKGDGRTIDEYKKWLKKTLQLNCNMLIVTEEKFVEFFLENRNPNYNTSIKTINVSELHYYKYYDQMKSIIDSETYQAKIKDPNRVECKLPEYNIIQYSKFHCLQMAIEDNPFQSELFFWLDAGGSRFFLDVDIQLSFPSQGAINVMLQNPCQFFIQKRHDLEKYPIDDAFIWNSENLLCGTMFGGDTMALTKMAEKVEEVLVNEMLLKNNVNNEQLALAMVWKKNPELFYLIPNYSRQHLVMVKMLSM